MIQIIHGAKGSGKTKQIIDSANNSAENAKGLVVYIDKDSGRIHDLDNSIRLVDAVSYGVASGCSLLSFVKGMLAGNFDIEKIGTNPKVKLYWGLDDALTFVKGNKGNGTRDDREGFIWDNIVDIAASDNGVISHTVSGLQPDTRYYYRLQIVNDEGETWSFDTQWFDTL